MNDEVRIRGSLERFVGESRLSDSELRELARLAWVQRGVAIFFPDQLINWRDRVLVENVATRLYGKRENPR